MSSKNCPLSFLFFTIFFFKFVHFSFYSFNLKNLCIYFLINSSIYRLNFCFFTKNLFLVLHSPLFPFSPLDSLLSPRPHILSFFLTFFLSFPLCFFSSFSRFPFIYPSFHDYLSFTFSPSLSLSHFLISFASPTFIQIHLSSLLWIPHISTHLYYPAINPKIIVPGVWKKQRGPYNCELWFHFKNIFAVVGGLTWDYIWPNARRWQSVILTQGKLSIYFLCK